MRRVTRAFVCWLVSRRTLHKTLRELDKELEVSHTQHLGITVQLARAERRIRELENQNLRLIRFNDFQVWESEMRKSS